MMSYSWPLLIVGLGGMINEVLNRILLDYRLPFSFEENKEQVGIFNANFKVAALVNIFIQVFRIGSMMHAMMRRRDQYIFQPTHFAYQFGMHEYAPDLRGRINKYDIERLKAHQRQRYKIDKAV